MSFFRILIIIFFIFFSFANNLFANEESTQKDEVLEQTKQIAQELSEDEEVPLNDPFAGNEGTSSMASLPEEEQEDEMSLYKFKLAGLISGKDHSYISLVNAGGEIVTLTLGQYLGKIKFVDLRLNEAIFEKEDKSFIIIDFNNQIREANEY